MIRDGIRTPIEQIHATVKTPVPRINEIAEPAAGETPVVYADVEGDGTQMPEDDRMSEDKTVRDFKNYSTSASKIQVQ